MENGQTRTVPDAPRPTARQRLISLKLVFFCIQAGLWTFFAVVLFLRMTSAISRSLDPDVGRILWAIGASITCFTIVICVVLRRISGRMMGACQEFDAALARYFTVMVIGLAVCEMAALFQVISLLFSEQINIPIILFFINALLAWSLFPAAGKLFRIFQHYNAIVGGDR